MSNDHDYCTTKDLGKAISVIAFIMIGIPMMIVMSYDDYPNILNTYECITQFWRIWTNDTDG